MSGRFSGTQDFRRTANVPDDVAFTACGWARLVTDRNDYSSLCCLEDATSNATHFINFQTDVDGTSLTCFTDSHTFGTQALTVGTDFFWAITVAGLAAANHTLYYRAAGSNAFTTLAASGSNRAAMTPTILRIGASSYGEQWNGRIWNVKVWDRALTAAELLVESYFARTMFPASINVHWPIKNDADTRDISGNARTPTVTGTITTEDDRGLFGPRRRVFLPTTTSPDVTLALTGQSASFSAGTLLPSDTLALTGQSATFTAGTLVEGDAEALTGQTATFTAGTLSAANTVPLAGITATFSAGTLSPAGDVTTALTGLSATFSAGTLALATSMALTGQSATFTAGALAAALSIPLTGQTASFSAGQLTVAGDITQAITGLTTIFSAGILAPSGGDVSLSADTHDPIWNRHAQTQVIRESELKRNLEKLHGKKPKKSEPVAKVAEPAKIVAKPDEDGVILAELITQEDERMLNVVEQALSLLKILH